MAGPVRILAALLATMGLAGCDFGLVEVEQSTPTWLELTVQSEGASGVVGGRGSFYAGTAGGGEPLPVSDEHLWVNDQVVVPELSDAGVRRYDLPEVAARPGFDSLRIRPPMVPARPVGPSLITVPPLQMDAPDTLVATRSELIRIRLSGYDPDDPGGGVVVPGLELIGTGGSWRLRVRPDSAGAAGGAVALTIDGSGPPPPLLFVPVDLLGPAFHFGWIHVDLGVVARYRSHAEEYFVGVQRSVRSDIPLRIVPDESSRYAPTPP